MHSCTGKDSVIEFEPADPQAANTYSNPYLATKWQRLYVAARFTSGARRFPTPQPTTTHLLLPAHRMKTSLLLPISQPNSDSLDSKVTQRADPGGAGSAAPSRRRCRTQKLTRNFVANGSPPCSAGKKTPQQRPDAQRTTGRP